MKTQASAFDIVFDKTLTVTQNGVSREMTAEEALHHQTYQQAISGSRLAQREVLKMIAKRETARAATGHQNLPRVTFRMQPVDPENADAALQILNIAAPDARWDRQKNERARLLLEPWAVQAALSRRRGGKRLDDKEVKEIERCTRDPATLRWPRGNER